jgi:CPSF A subunit region
MIPSSEGDTVICVGTVFLKYGEKEPSQGRLLLFKAELDARLSRKRRQLKQISELEVEGCVYALARVNGLLAAAIGPVVGSLFPVVSAAESGTVTGFSVQN